MDKILCFDFCNQTWHGSKQKSKLLQKNWPIVWRPQNLKKMSHIFWFGLSSKVKTFYQISVNFSETWTLMMLRPILELKRGDEMARFSHLIAIIYLKHKGYFKMLFLNLTLIQKLLPDEFKLAALLCWLLKRLSPFVDILVLIMNFFPKYTQQKRTRA